VRVGPCMRSRQLATRHSEHGQLRGNTSPALGPCCPSTSTTRTPWTGGTRHRGQPMAGPGICVFTAKTPPRPWTGKTVSERGAGSTSDELELSRVLNEQTFSGTGMTRRPLRARATVAKACGPLGRRATTSPFSRARGRLSGHFPGVFLSFLFVGGRCGAEHRVRAAPAGHGGAGVSSPARNNEAPQLSEYPGWGLGRRASRPTGAAMFKRNYLSPIGLRVLSA